MSWRKLIPSLNVSDAAFVAETKQGIGDIPEWPSRRHEKPSRVHISHTVLKYLSQALSS